jgi:hypothetical protein
MGMTYDVSVANNLLTFQPGQISLAIFRKQIYLTHFVYKLDFTLTNILQTLITVRNLCMQYMRYSSLSDC